MRIRPSHALTGCICLLLTGFALEAAELRLRADETLAQLVGRARAGDTLRVPTGHYAVTQLVLDKPLVLAAEDADHAAILDGGGQGDVIRVTAPQVTIRGFTIRNSGMDLTAMNAGVFIERNGSHCLIEDNVFDRTAFGIWVDGADRPVIRGNRIRGNPDYLSPNRGNGVHLWSVSGAIVEDNEIWETRDAIYIEVSHGGNVLQRNHMHHLRYGIHYMYSHRNRIIDNYTHDTRAGFALMQSSHLEVLGNRSEHDLEYGILLNFLNYSEISGNSVRHVGGGAQWRRGGKDGKALFVFNSLHNRILRNLFADCDMGIHLTAGSEGNRIDGNAFVNNRVQVKYVATRPQEWSRQGRGNYWSDYLGWDLDANGVGDRPYEPNDNVDRILWRYPTAKVLMHSPAVQTLRWVQGQFPVLKAQGVRDSFPLMTKPGDPGDGG